MASNNRNELSHGSGPRRLRPRCGQAGSFWRLRGRIWSLFPSWLLALLKVLGIFWLVGTSLHLCPYLPVAISSLCVSMSNFVPS